MGQLGEHGGMSGSSLTDGGHNLSFQSELALEPSCNVADASLAISDNVRHLPDMVEHVSAGEEEYRYQADGGPNVAVLDDGQYIRRGANHCRTDAEDDGHSRSPSDPVDRSLHWGMRPVR